ncbi:type II toxin-antitoxin system HipA family toxin [Sphaerotilus montanus]|uniref:Serine/threonine-protein kinase HipA n=1 Tax=Sphaerotilus montanus TaxID=522889 RepID=A0A7Y9QYV2_9BURK|nr:type II toxin-antitoxin system HipA family toxin [Sphaerotilus montanus]NYG32544.1 serine/threonine-protein kinase HipA [Sphaerotilus montanus]NZD56331.1 type II toxin-antitoxin system HipA family toxin [Sphaerotilus montanus]
MTRTVKRLRVLLGDLPVGRLTLDDAARCEFHLLESYRHGHPRPVLGQSFEDDLGAHRRALSRLPAWFSNLLPEGALRELVARDAGVEPAREFRLLEHLSHDLPGAIRIEQDDHPAVRADAESADALEDLAAGTHEDSAWHFSLAGVQLKFSALRSNRGMTVPVSGQGGDWILKLPDLRYPGVPANEHATMHWAAASGITIPEIDLVDIGQVSGLPATGIPRQETQAFVIRRFDRPVPGKRLHMEDFNQILGLYPEQKYARFNYETIARLTLVLTGVAGLEELIRRYVFMLASGNGDAHHKNWTLIYPDGVQAALSPAYDLVSTIQYMPDDRLALNFGRSKRWEDMGMATFRRLARKIDFDEAQIVGWTLQAVAATQQAWSASSHEFGYDLVARERVEQHMRRVPLFSTP